MRSLLAVPATNPRFVEKAAASAADAVFLDLEDAVVPELKVEGRAKAVAAINGVDWGTKKLAVRVNDLVSPWGHEDLMLLAREAKRLDFVIVPKMGSASDVQKVESLVEGSGLGIAALLETARGVAHAEAIAAGSDRMMAMLFGPGDYALDLGILDGSADTSFAQARIANACHAYGLAAIDGPYFDIANSDGCRASCKRAASMGFAGKMAIHPTQVDVANEAFSPTIEQVAWANNVLQAMEAAGLEGRGAVKTKDGQMIDLVHIRIARGVLERAKQNKPRR